MLISVNKMIEYICLCLLQASKAQFLIMLIPMVKLVSFNKVSLLVVVNGVVKLNKIQ